MEARLLAFLERLLGEPVEMTDAITVSSTQRARLVAWLNENSIPANLSKLKTNFIRVPELLSGAAFGDGRGENEDEPAFEQSPGQQILRAAKTSPRNHGTVLGVGIDIQARSSMPEVPDFRADRFYSANFSPQELGHCIEQSDPLMSLAGVWAAKEAILKAGAGRIDKSEGLAAIEVVREDDGSPYYPDCLVSISHDQGIAVAVCVRLR